METGISDSQLMLTLRFLVTQVTDYIHEVIQVSAHSSTSYPLEHTRIVLHRYSHRVIRVALSMRLSYGVADIKL